MGTILTACEGQDGEKVVIISGYHITAQDRGLLHLRNFNKISDFFEIVPKLCSKLTAIEILRECRDFKKFSAHSQPY